MKSKRKLASRAASTGRGKKSKKRSRSELARYAAKHKRINRQNPRKKYVLADWHEWQGNKDLYATQSAFIDSMLEKNALERRETIRRWIKEFERAAKSQPSWNKFVAFTFKINE